MNGWMNGWIDGWMDGKKWINSRVPRLGEWMDGYLVITE